MLNSSSTMLVQVFGREINAQLLLNPTEFDITIVASKLAYASNRHGFSWIYVQSCSMILPDDESSKGNAIDMKKLRENFERKSVKNF